MDNLMLYFEKCSKCNIFPDLVKVTDAHSLICSKCLINTGGCESLVEAMLEWNKLVNDESKAKKPMTIVQKIKNHHYCYKIAGFKDNEIPPYRLTCKEHRELRKIDSNNHCGGMIKNYYGVDIEVVTIVDEY